MLTPGELTRDPRARRQVQAAIASGWEVVGACGQFPGDSPASPASISVARTDAGSLMQPTGRAIADSVRGRDGRLLLEIRGLYQLLRLARLTRRLARAARPLGPADIVHANDFDTLPAGYLLARYWGAKLVYDAHELYLDVESRPPLLHREAVRLLQRVLGRAADAVITVSDPIADELARELRLRRRPLVVLNCAEAHASSSSDPAPHDGPLRIIYQASTGPTRFPEDILAALETTADVRATLRIAGVNRVDLQSEIDARDLRERVVLADPVPPSELVESLTGFDVGLVIDRPIARNAAYALPNKLFEYLMAGLAVAVPALPAMGRLVEEREFGLTFEAGNPASLGRTLRRLAADRELLATLSANARAAARSDLNAERQMAETTRLWEELRPSQTGASEST